MRKGSKYQLKSCGALFVIVERHHGKETVISSPIDRQAADGKLRKLRKEERKEKRNVANSAHE